MVRPVFQDDELSCELPAGRQKAVASSEKCDKTVHLQQKSKELQERLMVSEATVQAQAEQLKDYRELLSEWTLSHLTSRVTHMWRFDSFSKICNPRMPIIGIHY